ncbi:MAG: peptide chain release factor N(5)-glutamine methyltransferase [bacterium]|nr:peptide chain release factor N(5)-glutamine methyltransferase [bacterium]
MQSSEIYQVDQWLKNAVAILDLSQVPSSRLDALILLEDATGKDRAWLLAHPDYSLKSLCKKSDLVKLDKLVQRRADHEPLAYIRGKSEFYGREFLVTPATLQPRSETETMITILINLLHNKSIVKRARSFKPVKNIIICDIGTGSGAIAITAKLEIDDVTVIATDVQLDALEVAKNNAVILKAKIKFYLGNLLEPLKNQDIDVIVANLPYVPNSHTVNQAAMQEPKVAIFGGSDGLDLYRQMFKQLSSIATKPVYVLTESLPYQHKQLATIAAEQNYKVTNTEDFIQVFSLTDVKLRA